MCPFCWTQTAAGCLLQCPLLWMESPTRDTHTILVSLCSPLLSCDVSPFLAVPSFPKLPITVLPYPCLLFSFLFQFHLLQFLYLSCSHTLRNKACVLSPKQMMIHPQRQKKKFQNTFSV